MKLILAVSAALLVCGGLAKATTLQPATFQGKVTLEGKPFAGAMIYFSQNGKPVYWTRVDAKGNYSLNVYPNRSYRITVRYGKDWYDPKVAIYASSGACKRDIALRAKDKVKKHGGGRKLASFSYL